MDYTQHYNLKKPTYGEAVDVKDLNDNAEITDAQLNTLSGLVAARLLKTDLVNQIINNATKAASAATVYSVNDKVDSVISDLARKHISPTFKSGYSAEGNRGYITISGKTITLNLGVYSNAGFGAGEVVASIPAEYAPTLTFATGCYIGSAIDKIESVGYAYISTTGDILIADSNFTGRKVARLVVSYQIV